MSEGIEPAEATIDVAYLRDQYTHHRGPRTSEALMLLDEIERLRRENAERIAFLDRRQAVDDGYNRREHHQ